MHALSRIIRYLQGTQDHGLQMFSLKLGKLTAYLDANWAGYPDSRRSTSDYCVYLGENLISWSSKQQQTVSRSSDEAKYRGVANTVAETFWIRNLLLELHIPMTKATLIFCDNISSVYMSNNPVQHQRTKHVEIDLHFVCEKVALGQVKVLHIPSSLQNADIFTKGLPTSLFNEF
ncbi:Retrovirus-related Pol polyprotein from transposon RE1 [Cardamine amara subsp. amara]|uniref:Retrovirus-related Pol polyprotein from transposon RE1 n=1 Tax=Cardamine amara subsp. amara TaxID=228776 RepID=A0ABD1A2U5_CARAN